MIRRPSASLDECPDLEEHPDDERGGSYCQEHEPAFASPKTKRKTKDAEKLQDRSKNEGALLRSVHRSRRDDVSAFT